MEECLVEGRTLPETYHRALEALYDLGEITDCENQTQKSKQKEISMTMVIKSPLAEPMISKLWIGGPYDLERYRQEMIDGAADFCIGHGWHYTYHDRMVNYPDDTIDYNFCRQGINQIQFVIDELKRCPESRRAVINVRSFEDMNIQAADPACLQLIHYFIRNNKLHCKVIFRSNDATEATFMNAWALIMLQKEIADALNIEVGSYVHRANSFHCYEKNFDMLEGYVKRIRSDKELTYNYKGEFEDYMEDEKEKVNLFFKDLKRKIDC